MAEMAPNLFKAVPKRTAKRRTVAQALHNRSWTQDVKGARTVEVMLDYWSSSRFGILWMVSSCTQKLQTNLDGN